MLVSRQDLSRSQRSSLACICTSLGWDGREAHNWRPFILACVNFCIRQIRAISDLGANLLRKRAKFRKPRKLSYSAVHMCIGTDVQKGTTDLVFDTAILQLHVLWSAIVRGLYSSLPCQRLELSPELAHAALPYTLTTKRCNTPARNCGASRLHVAATEVIWLHYQSCPTYRLCYINYSLASNLRTIPSFGHA